MPDTYQLTIDGKSFDLQWSNPQPPTQQDIEGIVTQYRRNAKPPTNISGLGEPRLKEVTDEQVASAVRAANPYSMRAATLADVPVKNQPDWSKVPTASGTRSLSYDPTDPLGYARALAQKEEGTAKGKLRGIAISMVDPRNLPLLVASGGLASLIRGGAVAGSAALAGKAGLSTLGTYFGTQGVMDAAEEARKGNYGAAAVSGGLGLAGLLGAGHELLSEKGAFPGAYSSDNLLPAAAPSPRVFHDEPPSISTPSQTPPPVGDLAKGTGRFRNVYSKVDKDLGDLVNSAASAPEQAKLYATQATRNVLGGLNDVQRAAVGDYLVSERLKTVNPEHGQILDPTETAAIQADPAIMAAVEKYKAVKQQIEDFRLRTGLSEEAAAGKGEEFISLIRPEQGASPKPSGTTAAAMRKGRTRFAQQATGEADAYSTDLQHILETSFNEVVQKARINDIWKKAGEKGLLADEAHEGWMPEEVWKRPAQDADGNTVMVPVTKFAPAELVKAIRDVRLERPEMTGPIPAISRGIQKASTTAALTANPPELINHMFRIGEAFSNLPPADRGVGVRIAEAALPYFGPKIGAAIRLLGTDMSLPDNQAVFRDVFEAGGGSNRAFQENMANIPGLSKLQHWSHDMLFSLPEGRGVKGFDLRVRVAAEKIRRAIEGNTDPQRTRDFANQFGQYTSKPDFVVEAVKQVNPYAATQLPLRVTEVRQTFGGSGLKAKSFQQAAALRAETLYRGIGGVALGMTMLNKLLSGHYPWQNPPGKQLMVDTGVYDKDGKKVYADMRAFSRIFSRVASSIGARQMLEDRGKGGSKKSYPLDVMTGVANQGFQTISSPASNTALTALSGYAPYLTKKAGGKSELLDVAKNEKGGRVTQQLKAAVRGANPLGGLVVGGESERYQMQKKQLKVLNYLLGGTLKK